MKDNIFIKIEDKSNLGYAIVLSKELSLPILNSSPKQENTIILLIGQNDISIKYNKYKPLRVDFLNKEMLYRLKNLHNTRQNIGKAIGCKNNYHPTILDATAGMGTDAFILAALGAKVTMAERNPIIHILLKNGLERANQNPKIAEIASNLKLIHTDSENYLQNTNDYYDVIYLDPMFPEQNKTALSKKEMEIFKVITQENNKQKDDLILEIALKKAKQRVVVKRPLKGPYLENKKPTSQIEGKSSRFDIYIT